jgi:ribosomal RNA-processing protein 36
MPLPLGKRVKARADVSEDENDYEQYSEDDSSASIIETGADDGVDILDSSDEDVEEDVKDKLSSISFGTLSRAQESISKKRKRPAGGDDEKEDKLEALRARLRELRESKGVDTAPKKSKKGGAEKSTTTPAAKKSRTTKDDDSASDNSDSDEDGPPHARSSKHAPMAQASNRQVTRKRQVIDVPKQQVRDPRFGPLGGPVDETALAKKYSFINDYQDSEMAELKTAIKKSKSEDEKAILKRALLSMESKKKARENKDREQEVIREHRKKEKAAIAEGKNPFYLKKSDQKQQALVNKFDSMKSKDRERLIERRRKKVSQKEMKNMPAARRM